MLSTRRSWVQSLYPKYTYILLNPTMLHFIWDYKCRDSIPRKVSYGWDDNKEKNKTLLILPQTSHSVWKLCLLLCHGSRKDLQLRCIVKDERILDGLQEKQSLERVMQFLAPGWCMRERVKGTQNVHPPKAKVSQMVMCPNQAPLDQIETTRFANSSL